MIDEITIQKIEDYLSGELSEEEAGNLISKIDNSEDLKEYFLESQKLWNFMGSADIIEPKGDYVTKFWNNVSREEEKRNKSFFNFNFFNRKWAFVSSLAVFLLLSTIIVNNFVIEEEKTGYVYDAEDELLLNNLEDALSMNSSEQLNVYGPWEDLEN